LFFKAAAEGIGNADYKSATSIYDFTVTDIDGNQVSLEKYRCVIFKLILVHVPNECNIKEFLFRNHVCIIVNVASKCGYTHGNLIEGTYILCVDDSA